MSRSILPEPPDELKELSLELQERLRREWSRSGFVPFARFMERALYEPGLGYYSAGLHKFGPQGDFVTAPEIGALFATCLAAQIAEAGQALGAYDILELGAGSGRLAAGILHALPEDARPQRYAILERSADLRAVQREAVSGAGAAANIPVHWLDEPPAGWRGIVLANEVVDALPAERFRLRGGGIEQAGVTFRNGGCSWDFREAPRRLAAAVGSLGLNLAEPYTSEILPELPAWLQSVTGGLERGLALFIDYGYPRAEYYLPERRAGTLMCHYRHRAHADPFFWPGLQDLTAWVDFTALAEAGEACGLELSGYTSQALFLLGCGLDAVLAERVGASDDEGLKVTAEARQLTHPGMMGERFQVMALSRGMDVPLRGFSVRDLSYRL